MEKTNPDSAICAVSVVIPMYNVERYIGDTLYSLLNQTLKNFEVVIVDDCSPDNSRAVAERYLKNFDGRLRIYANEKNSGAAASRNRGLMISRGKYVFFMDSDDLLLLTGLEKMYETAEEFNADVINLSAFYQTSENAKEITMVNHRIKRVFSSDDEKILIDDDLAWRLKKPMDWRFYSVPWLRFFRRDFLIKNKLFFPENVMRCEDVVWKHGFLILAKRIVHASFANYFYRMSAVSLSRKKRTPTEYINSRMTTIIDGIKWIDDVMSQIDFFDKNPQYRYSVFEEFMNDVFRRLLAQSQKKDWAAATIFEAVKQGFGEKLGKHDVPVAELCALIDDQMREMSKLKEQLKGN